MAKKITTWYDDIWREWCACEGDYDLDVPVESGKTEAEAVENLMDCLDVPNDGRFVECPHCNGDGVVETGEYRIDRHDGSVSYAEVKCSTCHGRGWVEEDLPLITEEDLDEMETQEHTP